MSGFVSENRVSRRCTPQTKWNVSNRGYFKCRITIVILQIVRADMYLISVSVWIDIPLPYHFLPRGLPAINWNYTVLCNITSDIIQTIIQLKLASQTQISISETAQFLVESKWNWWFTYKSNFITCIFRFRVRRGDCWVYGKYRCLFRGQWWSQRVR